MTIELYNSIKPRLQILADLLMEDDWVEFKYDRPVSGDDGKINSNGIVKIGYKQVQIWLNMSEWDIETKKYDWRYILQACNHLYSVKSRTKI